MGKRSKIQKGSIKKTVLEIIPFTLRLFDPEIVSNPKPVIAKMLISMATYFTTKLFSEFKDKVKDGILKKENLTTEKPILILVDLLKIIDEGKIDEERFKAMKSIFFFSIEKGIEKEQEEFVYLLFQTAKQLSSAEILILSANFNIVTGKNKPSARGIDWSRSHTRINDWAQAIAEQVGHNLSDFVLQNEQHLIDLKLISDRHYPIETTRVTDSFEPTSYYRLTALGYKLCECILKYN